MRAGLRTLLVALALWLTAASGCLAAPRQIAPDTEDFPQQVLVFLRLPPAHFRGNSDYTGSYGDGLGRMARQRLAAGLARKQGLTLVTGWPMPVLGVDCYVMEVPAGRKPTEVASQLARDRRVAWAEPMAVFHAQGGAMPYNDPLFAAQPANRLWQLADLHEIATGENVRVAIIDSLIEANHPDLLGQVEVARNFVPERGDTPEEHGTAVAGVIAARANNSAGIVGIAPRARLMALRACWQTAPQPGNSWPTVCNTLSLAKALDFAISHQADVINLSLSGPAHPLLGKLLDAALSRGITVVGAFDAALPDGGFPASHPGVVAVSDELSGTLPGGVFVAPGRGVPATQPGGRWYLVNGSSYAAAHVSGLFALLRQRNAGKAAPLVVVAQSGERHWIDACASLVRTAGPCACACARHVAYAAPAKP